MGRKNNISTADGEDAAAAAAAAAEKETRAAAGCLRKKNGGKSQRNAVPDEPHEEDPFPLDFSLNSNALSLGEDEGDNEPQSEPKSGENQNLGEEGEENWNLKLLDLGRSKTKEGKTDQEEAVKDLNKLLMELGKAPPPATAESKPEPQPEKKNKKKAKKPAAIAASYSDESKAKGNKKQPKHVRAMQEALARRKEAEERKRREEEERLRKEEEERRGREEEERLAEEAKRRKKEREKEKKLKKKQEGKLLTGKQKEEQRRLEAMRLQFLSQSGEGLGTTTERVIKKPKYETKKQKPKVVVEEVKYTEADDDMAESTALVKKKKHILFSLFC